MRFGLLLLSVLCGCMTSRGRSGARDAASAESGSAAADGSAVAGDRAAVGGGGAAGSGGTQDADPIRVCESWLAARRDREEGVWSGSVNACDAGDVDAGGRARALAQVNAWRALAQLPALSTRPDRDAYAQECALLMHANGALSHNPPSHWACYTDGAALGAGSSNIATAPGVGAVALYMVDNGNESTLGHRRWILSEGVGPIGLGSTDRASCMWVFAGEGQHTRPYVAFPPAGVVPLEVFGPVLSWPGAPTLDDTGWSIQSEFTDLSGAEVRVTREGQELPVALTVLEGGYGAASAIGFRPVDWRTTAGHYTVSVTRVVPEFEYTVSVVDCDAALESP